MRPTRSSNSTYAARSRRNSPSDHASSVPGGAVRQQKSARACSNSRCSTSLSSVTRASVSSGSSSSSRLVLAHVNLGSARRKGLQGTLFPNEALPQLPQTLPRGGAPTAERPVDYFRGDRCRRVAAGDPGEGRRADEARAARSSRGIKLQLRIIATAPRTDGAFIAARAAMATERREA
jgi:hypothetical protein